MSIHVRSQCNCYPGGALPSTYEGPQEDCPVHGRPYGEWVERATDATARAETAEAAVARVRTLCESWLTPPVTQTFAAHAVLRVLEEGM